MRAKLGRVRIGAVLMAATTAVGLVVLPACDPATLSEDQRRLVTGTTDVGDVTLTVDPSQATIEDTFTFSYHVSSRHFAGTLALALSALPTEVAIVKDVSHKTPVAVDGDRDLDGTFELRVVGEREPPVEISLNLTSVGVAGSRVEHPPARIRLFLRPSGLALECHRDPKEGTAPLAVQFGARATACLGACRVRWAFGDGIKVDEPDSEHTYEAPGDYLAVAVLTDEGGRITACKKEVSVRPRPPEPGPAPTPTPTPAAPGN